MKRTIAAILIAAILAGCSAPTPAPIPMPGPTPTLSRSDYERMNAAYWSNVADSDQRREIATYFLDFWQFNAPADSNFSLTADEMAACIAEQVSEPEAPGTMLIMSLAAKCIAK